MIDLFCAGVALILNTPPKNLKCLGEYKVTAYCACEECCGEWAENREFGKVIGAAGVELVPDYSIATDAKLLPYGTKIIMDGKEYEAHDAGAAVKGNCIDVYFDDHEIATQYGVQYKKIYVESEEKELWM